MTPLREAQGPHYVRTYEITGSLTDLSAPAGPVEALTVDRADLSVTGLRPLADLRGLASLSLTRSGPVDLAPLRETTIDTLLIHDCEGVDLRGLRDFVSLRSLRLTASRIAPLDGGPVRLPATLESLMIVHGDDPLALGRLIEAIDWTGPDRLRDVGLGTFGPPCVVDFAFVTLVPTLERMEIATDVSPLKSTSPFVAPFVGLPTGIRSLVVSEGDAVASREALRQHLSRPGNRRPEITVTKAASTFMTTTSQDDDPDGLIPPEEDGERWLVDLHLAEYEELAGHPATTEAEALERAKALIASKDPDLLSRIEFDQEASGTGAAAHDPHDLRAMLRCLGF